MWNWYVFISKPKYLFIWIILSLVLINVSKNTAKKHYNIIFSNSHKKIHNIFKFERNIRNGKGFLGEVNKIKYKIFTNPLFNIYLILLLYSSISISVVQKHFSMLNSQIVV